MKRISTLRYNGRGYSRSVFVAVITLALLFLGNQATVSQSSSPPRGNPISSDYSIAEFEILAKRMGKQTQTKEAVTRLTAEEARFALIRLMGTDKELQDSLFDAVRTRLNRDPFRIDPTRADAVEIGAFRVDLAEATFTFGAKPILFKGGFSQDQRGQWRAEVTARYYGAKDRFPKGG